MNAIKIFILVLFLLVVSNLYSQSGEAKSLEIGNKWFYKSVDLYNNTISYFNQEVIGDTTIQNQQYAIVFHFITDTAYFFQRADSSKIYSFSTYSMQEIVAVDFNAPDTSGMYFYIVNDSVYFWSRWRARQCNSMWGGLGQSTTCYVKGVGTSGWSYDGHSAWEYTELIAGIIEGVFYGDSTVLNLRGFDDQSVKDFSLSQNYPNPFNPVTTITYQIPIIGFVTLKVYDVLGNEVATLVNEEKPAGSYEVEWNETTLPSGIYFYRLQVGNFVETKKMLLLK